MLGTTRVFRSRLKVHHLACLVCLSNIAATAQPKPDLEVSFEFLHNQIILHSMLNGKGPFNTLLDTGTNSCTIDSALARRLRLPLTRKSEGSGVGDKRFFTRSGVVDELRIGGLRVAQLPVNAIDLSAVSRELGRQCDGVLGYSFLESRIVQIDYFQRRVRFFSESPYSTPIASSDTPRRISFPMQFRPNSILPVFEDCFVNGTRLSITLDTGSSLGLILFPQAIRHLGLESLAATGIPLHPTGYAGKARLTKGWARSVALKTIDLGAIEAAFAERGYGEHEALERRGGNLGNAVLQDFLLTLDYVHRVVTLEKIED
jgi:hypothetical protein